MLCSQASSTCHLETSASWQKQFARDRLVSTACGQGQGRVRSERSASQLHNAAHPGRRGGHFTNRTCSFAMSIFSPFSARQPAARNSGLLQQRPAHPAAYPCTIDTTSSSPPGSADGSPSANLGHPDESRVRGSRMGARGALRAAGVLRTSTPPTGEPSRGRP